MLGEPPGETVLWKPCSPSLNRANPIPCRQFFTFFARAATDLSSLRCGQDRLADRQLRLWGTPTSRSESQRREGSQGAGASRLHGHGEGKHREGITFPQGVGDLRHHLSQWRCFAVVLLRIRQRFRP